MFLDVVEQVEVGDAGFNDAEVAAVVDLDHLPGGDDCRFEVVVSSGLSAAVVQDVAALMDVYNGYPQDKDHALLRRIAQQRLGLVVDFLPLGDMPQPGPKPFFSLLDQSLSAQIGRQISRPFWIDTVGEDIVLSWAMLDKGYRIGYAEDAIVFTNAPTTFKQFALQRKRWSRGLIEALHHHEDLLFVPRLSAMFIWWNLLFLPLDLVYTLIFIPGVIAAIFFQVFWIAGPMTLAVLPLAGLWNLVIYRVQRQMMHDQGLKVRHNPVGLVFYLLVYALLMQPVCVWGYWSELLGLTKKWGTK